MTSLQILEGNDWTGASEIEKLIQDAISKEERIQKEKDDNTPSCYCQPSISGGHKGKVEKILKGSLDLIPLPSPSVKIQSMGGKICLRCKGKTLLDFSRGISRGEISG